MSVAKVDSSLTLNCGDRQTIFVARYANRHGDQETRAFTTEALALAWKEEMARANWDAGRDGVPPSDIGDAYFEHQHDRSEECFSLELCRLLDGASRFGLEAGRDLYRGEPAIAVRAATAGRNVTRGIPLCRFRDSCLDEKLSAHREDGPRDPNDRADKVVRCG